MRAARSEWTTPGSQGGRTGQPVQDREGGGGYFAGGRSGCRSESLGVQSGALTGEGGRGRGGRARPDVPWCSAGGSRADRSSFAAVLSFCRAAAALDGVLTSVIA